MLDLSIYLNIIKYAALLSNYDMVTGKTVKIPRGRLQPSPHVHRLIYLILFHFLILAVCSGDGVHNRYVPTTWMTDGVLHVS